MVSRVILAIGFILIWYLVVLPITPQLLDSIVNQVENSGISMEVTYAVSTPKTVYDNETNTTKVVWEEQPYRVNFKPVLYIILIMLFYLGPLIGAIYIIKGGRHR